MRCIEIASFTNGGTLSMVERPIPKARDQEVLIRVAAAGVNRPDIVQRQGLYPAPKGASDLPGLEVAGEVIDIGEQVGKWQVGDQVCALLPGGGYAEYATAHQDTCLPVPPSLSLLEAATLPETYFTVWDNLFRRAGLQAGETVLIHGGSSGIGTTAIQLAKTFGAKVFITAGSPEKCDRCRQLGADLAINYRTENFSETVKRETDGMGANVILDMVGGDYIQKNIKAAAFGGRIVSIAFLHGSKVNVDLMPVMLKQLILTGSTMRTRPIEDKAAIAQDLVTQVWPLFSRQVIKPVMAKTFPLENATDAHRLMESSQHVGKIVLTI
ncbi:MAG: NAD(P)H-quinone oxidoreductase [Cellvibrionales bacterium]|nr:NAD(P)H-quinone oxidoreductase [Cellvibrionales bacterium]